VTQLSKYFIPHRVGERVLQEQTAQNAIPRLGRRSVDLPSFTSGYMPNLPAYLSHRLPKRRILTAAAPTAAPANTAAAGPKWNAYPIAYGYAVRAP
jgi:hypothetical protein